MAQTANTGRGGPSLFSSLGFLMLSFPLGIAWFVVLVTMAAVGAGTAIIWVGVPLLALAVLLCRGGASLERLRAQAMLGVHIASPYRPLPAARLAVRWRARLRDRATWRDLAYLLLLLPVGIVEFALMVAFWSLSLQLIAFPLLVLLPEEWQPDLWGDRLLGVDNVVDALPFSALGLLLLLVTSWITKRLGAAHASYASSLLGPKGDDS